MNEIVFVKRAQSLKKLLDDKSYLLDCEPRLLEHELFDRAQAAVFEHDVHIGFGLKDVEHLDYLRVIHLLSKIKLGRLHILNQVGASL